MGPDGFFSPRVLIVVGKGGVGKTTVSATLAQLAAEEGRRALVIDVEGKGTLSQIFGAPSLTYDEQPVAEGVWARTLTPEEALIDYFQAHNLGRLSRRLAKSNVIDYVATAVPGLKDIIVLGKVKALANEGRFDTIVVDSPAAGHAVIFLTGARGILDAVRVGPIRDQAREVLEMLEDHERCRIQLVTLPEETPVNETVETRSRLRERVDVAFGPVIVNSLMEPAVEPPPRASDIESRARDVGVDVAAGLATAMAAADRFRWARHRLHAEQTARLAGLIGEEPLRLPFCFSAGFGPDELAVLAAALRTALAGDALAS